MKKLLYLIFYIGWIMQLESSPLVEKNQMENIFRKNGILSDLKIKPIQFQLPEIKVMPISEFETLYVLEDSTLPLINLTLIIEGGILQESNEERGLYSVLLELWRNGGANGKSAETISEELAELGVEVNFQLNYEFIAIQMYCLKNNFLEAIKILKEILLYPEFAQDKLETIKLRYIDSIQRRNDKPEQIAYRKIKELMEYPDKILENVEKEDIEKITREQIRKAYKNILSSRYMHIALDGDLQNLDYYNIFKNLSNELGAVKNPYIVKNLNINNKGKGNNKYKNKILLIEKDIPQAVIVMGTFIPSYNSYSSYPLRVANYILGGGSFVSKMMREIRVKKGLAYFAYSSTKFSIFDGKFISASGTNSEQANLTLQLMLELINKLPEITTDEDLQITKDALINSFIFEFSTPTKILHAFILEKIYNSPIKLTEFPNIIQKLTKQEILKTYKEYIQPENLWIVVVGPKNMYNRLNSILPTTIFNPDTQIQ